MGLLAGFTVGATLAVAMRPGDLRGRRDARMNRRDVMAFRHDLFVGHARCVGHKMPARGFFWLGDRKGRPYNWKHITTMEKYNPEIHHRRSIRLQQYDYSQEGAYFITICAQDWRCLFGEVVNKEMYLNEYGQIVYQEWEKLPERWKHLELGAFQIMPNHMHGILIFNAVDVSSADLSNPKIQWALKPSVGQVVGAYCSVSATACLDFTKKNHPDVHLGKVWQRGFHEHVIRDLKAFGNISNYIINNPENWRQDKFYVQ